MDDDFYTVRDDDFCQSGTVFERAVANDPDAMGNFKFPGQRRRGFAQFLFKHRRCVVPDWWMRILIPLLDNLPMFILRWMRGFTYKWQK